MIHAFYTSWPLFGDTYLAAWLMAAMLGLAGLPFVLRDQVFVGVAIAQSSMLGIGVALWLATTSLGVTLTWLGAPLGLTLMAVLFATLTTLITLPGQGTADTAEGRTGWIYLLAGSLVLVLLAKSPIGLNQVNQLAVSSLIGATRSDVILLAGLLIPLVSLTIWRHQALLLLLIDRPQARAVGLAAGRWEIAIALVLGLVMGICLRMGGLLFTFGTLVLPGLTARHLCRELRTMLWVAPLLATTSAILGFMVGNYWDLPPAPLTVVFLALLLIPSRLFAYFRPPHRL